MANQFNIPKGPSNSTGMGATPGTQQTAQQNVVGANINPNMPVAPQLQKQAASSYQQSITPSPLPAPPKPSPTMRKPAPVRQTPVVSRAMPMDPGRGYNVFAGMDADQISGMNQKMGMSNMTALPSLAPAKSSMPAVDPDLSGFGLTPGRPMDMQVTGGKSTTIKASDWLGAKEAGNTYGSIQSGIAHRYDEETGTMTAWVQTPDGEWHRVESTPYEGSASGGGEFEEWYNEKAKESKDTRYQNYLDSWDGDIDKALDDEPVQGEDELDDHFENRYQTWADAYAVLEEEQQAAEQAELDAAAAESPEVYAESAIETEGSPGFDEEKVAELKAEIDTEYESAKDMLDQQYATQLDQVLAGIDRQAAMMGTFGAGAHSTSINNAIAGVLAQMADDYAAIDMKHANDLLTIGMGELAATEVDWQQNFANYMQLAGYDVAEIQSSIQNMKVIDDVIVKATSEYIGTIESEAAKSKLFAMLGEASGDLATAAYDSPEEQQAAVQEINFITTLVGEFAQVETGAISMEDASAKLKHLFGNLPPNSKSQFKSKYEKILDDLLHVPGVTKSTFDWTKDILGGIFGGWW